MFRKRVLGMCVIAMMALSMIFPIGGAEYETKTELTAPDETYYYIEGPPPLDEKDQLPESLSSSTSTYNVIVDMLKKGASATERSSVSFPYSNFNWEIGTWYRTSEGFRFYDVSYNNEKILYDYCLPWVKIGNMKYMLTSSMCTNGPDLYVYHTAQMFKVWIEYHIDEVDVYVEVYAYFGSEGQFNPWAVVDSNDKVAMTVAQRFDFDLDGAGDDNADFYTGAGWELVEDEDSHYDDGNPEDGRVQWSLYDTDTQGSDYIIDQSVDIIPYHPDDSYLYILRYHSRQKDDYPSTYDNDEATGLYSPSTYDPYIGYDLVAWYVSEYGNTRFCNPGPWIKVEV